MHAQSRIRRNAVLCKKCQTIAESKYTHDFVTCKCGAIFTDGGLSYIRRGGDFQLMEILDIFSDCEDEKHEEKDSKKDG